MPDNNDNSSSPSYQSVLNKYSSKSKTSEAPPLPPPLQKPINTVPSKPPSEPEKITPLQQTPPLEQPKTTPSPLNIKPPPPLSTSVPPVSKPLSSPPPPPLQKPTIAPPPDLEETTSSPNKPDIFKYIFLLSLLIFLSVAGYIIFTIISGQQTATPSLKSTPTPTTLPAPSNQVCRLNDQEYQIGQSFPAADDCNTCTCQPDLIISCTDKNCDQ